ncbi:MAG TPA: RecQ family ATP-dependent DNA helicase, partial [Candidatus Xenobia bacterium]
VHEDLRAGRLRLLYVAPERLAGERFVASLAGRNIALLAVDEAHCISEWGHNFRPDYLKIAELARRLHIPRVLALTATATPTVAHSIVRAFRMDAEAIVNTGFYRSNLRLEVNTSRERVAALMERIRHRPPGSTIVYVTLQRTAEDVAERLAEGGVPARAYHAGLAPEIRTDVQDWFMGSPRAVVVATIAFGMGIDKSDIRYVYHYNLPKSLENYAQEIGRAGRDGKPSVCELFLSHEDVTVLENFVYGDTPTAEGLTTLVEALLSQPETFDVLLTDLSSQSDIRPLVVETVLTYLELEGILQSTGPFYSSYKLQLTLPREEVLAHFDTQRRAFLERLLGQARPGTRWLNLDVDKASATLGEPRTRLVNAINYLEEKGWMTVQVAGVRQGYRRLQLPDVEAAVGTLIDRFEAREHGDLRRIEQVVQLATTESCLAHRLWGYFGDDSVKTCGNCSRCAGHLPPPRPAPRAVDEGRIAYAIGALPPSPALASPRQKARYLCGLASPMASRERLTRDPMFGALGQVPFHVVLATAVACEPLEPGGVGAGGAGSRGG